MPTTPFDESEVTGYKDQKYGRRIMLCTNNFFVFFWGEKGKSQFAQMMEELGILDRVYRDYKPDDTWASERRMNKTGRQFLEEVDHVAIEIHGSLERVWEVIKAWRDDPLDQVKAEEAFNILMPMYRSLRQKGYSIGDLQR